ncbi:MAG: alpha-ketoacid dehydrogenase subunit beta [Deltaproteobacteria bacterium]|nr:alpha-ketoacid dehydrogenase subunit beta [Deltaproteobacteria bacterium]
MAVMTYIEALSAGLREEMQRDGSVFILGEDVGTYGGAFRVTKGFLDEFGPDRIVDTPISESAIIGAAIGSAFMGMRPVAEMQFIDFMACAHDIIVNYAAKSRYRWGVGVPMVIRGPCGGGVSGGPFHSQNPESAYLNAPGLKIVAPSTAIDAKGLIKAAIRDDDPVIYLEHKFLYRRVKEDIPDGDWVVPIGKAAVARAGKDLSIITYGAMRWVATDAAEVLAGEGINVEVLDLRTLLPLDRAAIAESVKRTNKVLVLHEATLTGGPAGEITAIINEEAFEYLDAPVRRLAPPDIPVPYAPTLEKFFLPQVDDVVKAARELHAY